MIVKLVIFAFYLFRNRLDTSSKVLFTLFMQLQNEKSFYVLKKKDIKFF